MDIETILQQMTLEDKIALCSGENFWETKFGSEFFFPYCIFCTLFAVCLHRDLMLFPQWDVWQRL